jgi:hypothetical protein
MHTLNADEVPFLVMEISGFDIGHSSIAAVTDMLPIN